MTVLGAPYRLQSQLLAGETLIWSGRPKQGFVLAGRDALLIPFSLFWCGFTIYWETLAVGGGAPTFFALFGLPFILVGLFMVIGRFLLDRWLRAQTIYALTDSRILIERSGRWPHLTAVALDRLPEASLTESADGWGTVRFGQRPSMFGTRGSASWGDWVAALDPTPQFLMIPDARRVFTAVQERTAGRRTR